MPNLTVTVKFDWIETPRVCWKGADAPLLVCAYRLIVDGIPSEAVQISAPISDLPLVLSRIQDDILEEIPDPLPSFDVHAYKRRKAQRRAKMGLL